MEDRLLGHLSSNEQILYRAPRGWGRLNRRVLTLQAIAGLMVFLTVSAFEGQWSVETIVIFGGIIGLQLFQYLAYDFAITDQRVLWFPNRWIGRAETVWLKDINQVDLVWNPFFPALQVSGEVGELLTTGNFPGVRVAADRLVTLCRPARRFVPSESLIRAIDSCVALTLLMMTLTVLAIGVTFIAKMAAAEGLLGIIGYLFAIFLLVPIGLIGAGCAAMLFSAIFLRRKFGKDPMDVLLYLGRDPQRPGVEGTIERSFARVCAVIFTLGLVRRVRYDPSDYERVRYG